MFDNKSRWEKWGEIAESMGHELRLDEDGEVDFCFMTYEFHNGPGCSRCDDSWCEHCNPDGPKTYCPGSGPWFLHRRSDLQMTLREVAIRASVDPMRVSRWERREAELSEEERNRLIELVREATHAEP